MQCPRCQAAITSPPDASGALLCPGCGAKLLTKAAAAAARAATKPGDSGKVEAHHPSATLPPGTPLKRIPRPEELADRNSAEAATRAQFDAILAELRALRSVQDDILEMLRERGEAPPPGPPMPLPRWTTRTTGQRPRRHRCEPGGPSRCS